MAGFRPEGFFEASLWDEPTEKGEETLLKHVNEPASAFSFDSRVVHQKAHLSELSFSWKLSGGDASKLVRGETLSMQGEGLG